MAKEDRVAAVEAAAAAEKRMKTIEERARQMEERARQMAEENAVEVNRINAEAADRLGEMERFVGGGWRRMAADGGGRDRWNSLE